MSRPHLFDRSGLAALSDLEQPEWRELFGRLEAEQSRFLEHERSFRSADYRWPRDPLHTWSRCWEYPWTLHQLRRFRSGETSNAVDVGSGVTFMPFAVAALGYRVTCTDMDPACERDLPRAAAALGQDVGVRLTDGNRLPFSDGEVDAVYCVSVLEHIPTWERTVDEIARILKPGGLLALTIDLDLIGNSEIGPAAHRALVERLRERFEWAAPEVTVHPADLLTSTTGPYPLEAPPGIAGVAFAAKQMVKPLLGRKPVPPGGVHLAVHALSLRKR